MPTEAGYTATSERGHQAHVAGKSINDRKYRQNTDASDTLLSDSLNKLNAMKHLTPQKGEGRVLSYPAFSQLR